MRFFTIRLQLTIYDTGDKCAGTRIKYLFKLRTYMRSFAFIVSLLLFSLASPIIENVEAQTVTAAVDLTCTTPYPSGAVDVDVYPGATLTGYSICTVSNPTVHNEKISIQVQADGLAVAAPGSITLAPGGEEDFQVVVRADARMAMSSRTLTTTAQVTEINSVPPPNVAESTVNQIINIKQFSMLSVELVDANVELYTGDKATLEFKVYNQGNAMDKFLFEADVDQADELGYNLIMPAVSAEIESMGPPYKMRINLEAPLDGSDWEINSDGVKYLQTSFSVTVTSQFSCRHEGACNNFMVQQFVTFYHNETVAEDDSDLLSSATDNQMLIYGGGGAGVIILLMLVLAIRKKRS